MSRRIWPILTYCLWPLALVHADDTSLKVSPQPGVVLLRNGQVLSGKVTEAGEEYYVTLPSGEIRLKASQVELVCRDLREGYERKRSRIDPAKVQDHLDLAMWCIWQKLFDEASREVAEARSLNERHPRIVLVERQLKLAQEQPLHNDHKADAGNGPTTEDLDRLMRGMPPGTIETFANTIQPLLLNTCASGGCHGAQTESQLRLLRTQLGKTSSRRFTQRNLHAIVELIDRSDPPASPILTIPVGPHGNAKAAIFTNKDVAQYRQLVNWVMRVANGTAEQPQTVEKPDDNLLQQLPQAGKPAGAATAPNSLLTGETGTAAGGKSLSTVPKLTDKKPVRRVVTAAPETPEDPFAPEAFNAKYHPRDD
ncbi:MAG TPA: hypothetical protein VHD36_09045 [Pirellulales bacterium]|nr:hypothetical protein [Pirellulales bacterium]